MMQSPSLRGLLVAVVILLGAASACVAPAPERLTCENVLSPNQFENRDLVTLISGTTGKGCEPDEH